MKLITKILPLATLGLLLIPGITAAKVTFDMYRESDCVAGSPYGCGGWDTSRTYEDTNGTNEVEIGGYYGTATSTISKGEVESWSGVGVRTGSTDPYDNQPYHAIDNKYDEFEMVLFDFGNGNLMALNEVRLGYWSGDSDLSIAAYTKDNGGITDDTVSIIGDTWDNLTATASSDWTYVASASNPGTSTFNFNNSTTEANNIKSRYWLVGAYNKVLNGDAIMGRDLTDAVKLRIVAGNLSSPCTHDCGCTDPDGCGNDVPVPAPFLLMLGGLAFINRKKLMH